MHTVVFTLVLLACVIASAVLAQVVRHLSLPLVQIVAGVVVACIVPAVYGVDIPAELFLVLFIAPLLFDEARSINRRALWENKGAIFSLAVGLVLLTVLAVGFALHWFVPSIPLAAAFACAAALAPTDAAAVGALGSRVGLKPRQSTLLAGESLINDASGVVAFQFAIAAALTGAFSAADAAVSFARLFFGGIAVGAVLGMAAAARPVAGFRRPLLAAVSAGLGGAGHGSGGGLPLSLGAGDGTGASGPRYARTARRPHPHHRGPEGGRHSVHHLPHPEDPG